MLSIKPSHWQMRHGTFFSSKSFFAFLKIERNSCLTKADKCTLWKVLEIIIFLKNHTVNHNTIWNCITPSFLVLAIPYITFSDWPGCRSLPAIYLLRKGSIFSGKKKIQPDHPTYTPRTIPASCEFHRRMRYSNPGLSACNFSFKCLLFLRESSRWCIKIKKKGLGLSKSASNMHS